MRSKKTADYGFDAPWTVLALLAIGVSLAAFRIYWPAWSFVLGGVWMIVGSRFLKFRARDKILRLLELKGSEQTLDVGCGRGLLLIGTARKLTTGRATGIDLWRTFDQSGNSQAMTLQNAACEGVQVEVVTGDARKMPFEDGRFDALTSSWAIHNISGRAEREKALGEMLRVLKPGGNLVLLDIKYSSEYARYFSERAEVSFEKYGPDLTFGIPGYLFFAHKFSLNK